MELFSLYREMDPGNALALFGLGIANVFVAPCEQGQELEEAIQRLEQARKLEFPRDALGLYSELFFDPIRHRIWLDAETSWQKKGLYLCVCALFSEWALAEVRHSCSVLPFLCILLL